MGMWELLKMIASLVLVFGLLGALLWVLRRLQNKLQATGNGLRQLRLVESMSVGPRQKIVLMEVDNQRLLVGISAQQMQALGQWPITAPSGAEGAHHA